MPLKYEAIIKEAKKYANELKDSLPPLPTNEKLSPYVTILTHDFADLNSKVQLHISLNNPEPGHGYEHLRWVSTNGGYFADLECNVRSLESEIRKRLIKRSVLLGILHDIERYRGLKEHPIAGAKVGKQLMAQCKIEDNYIPELILRHDEMGLFSTGDIEFDVPFQSVFDADHILWGLEREESFWLGRLRRGMPPEEAIHDYKYLFALRNSFKTQHGKEIGPKFIDYGIAINQHIEKKFGS